MAPQADPSCKDVARLYLLPSCPPEAQPETDWHDGPLLEPTALPALPEPARRDAPRMQRRSLEGATLQDVHYAGVVLDGLAGTAPGARNAALFRAAVWREQRGFTEELQRRKAADPKGGFLHRITALGSRCAERPEPWLTSKLGAFPASGSALEQQDYLHRAGSAAWHGTRIEADIDELHRRLSKHARRNIAIAERAGVRIEASTGLDAVRSFHQLHVQLRKRKYRLLAQPFELFERIWHAFSDHGGIVTLSAHAGDELIAGAVFLSWGDTLYYKFGASRPEHLGLRPNDAIFWAGIRWAVAHRMRLLDWGLSDLDQPGLVAYKRKWASEERTIVTLRAGGEQARSSSDAGVVLGELTRLLTDDSVPDEVTARAGTLLYRYFC